MIGFRGARIFDGESFTGVKSVIVDRGRISAVAEQIPSGARVVDGGGCTLLPGFIDCHVHIGLFDPKDVLRGGVTCARDLGWPLNDLRTQDGPSLLFAGPILTAPGGYPSRASWAPKGTAREVESPDDARAAVRELVARGASVIKIAQEPRAGPTMHRDVVRAIVEEAHANGRKVTSHCGALSELEVALEAGVDELAHGLWSEEKIPDDTIARMVAAGMIIVPTLHIDPSRARIDNLRRFLAAGGRVVYGTDMGNPPVPAGIDAEELALMLKAGMTCEAALAAATARAADYLGLEDRGRLVSGARADLLLVAGDVSTDLSGLSRPVLVMRGGNEVTR